MSAAEYDNWSGPDPFTAPKARADDPSTSHAAVPSKRRRTSQSVRLLRAFATGWDMTDEDAARHAVIYLGSEYATRCSELRNEGLIEVTGNERLGNAGVPRMESRITQAGRDYLESLS